MLALGATFPLMGGAEVARRQSHQGESVHRGFSPRLSKRRRRLAPAIKGGNWQGQTYLTYAEHDRCVRATFGAPHKLARALRYDVMKREIIASR